MTEMTKIPAPRNACHPQYRNLSPAAECAARSRRTGIPERPGRLPIITGGQSTVAEQRAERVYRAIAAGCTTVAELRRATQLGGEDISRATTALAAQGRITSAVAGAKGLRRYEVAG